MTFEVEKTIELTVVSPVVESTTVSVSSDSGSINTETNSIFLNDVDRVAEISITRDIVESQTVVMGLMGPRGFPGVPEDEKVYSKRIDFVTEDILYRGEANPGALESAPVWRIRKITIAPDGDVSEEWADGDANFDNIWADRPILNYR